LGIVASLDLKWRWKDKGELTACIEDGINAP
jgi:hypothetical protein